MSNEQSSTFLPISIKTSEWFQMQGICVFFPLFVKCLVFFSYSRAVRTSPSTASIVSSFIFLIQFMSSQERCDKAKLWKNHRVNSQLLQVMNFPYESVPRKPDKFNFSHRTRFDQPDEIQLHPAPFCFQLMVLFIQQLNDNEHFVNYTALLTNKLFLHLREANVAMHLSPGLRYGQQWAWGKMC